MSSINITYQTSTSEIPEYREWKRLQKLTSLATTQIPTTTKPTMQVLYSYGLDPPDNLITFICKHLRDSEWTRIFCYAAVLLTIICGIIYTIRSIYTLRLSIERQRKNGRRPNRENSQQLSSDETELSRMFSSRPDPLSIRSERLPQPSPFTGDKSG